MKTIPIPTHRKERTRSQKFSEMAVQLRKLPAGQALPFSTRAEDIPNLHHSMKARGLSIRTAKIAEGQYAVWIAEDNA